MCPLSMWSRMVEIFTATSSPGGSAHALPEILFALASARVAPLRVAPLALAGPQTLQRGRAGGLSRDGLGWLRAVKDDGALVNSALPQLAGDDADPDLAFH